ncbi:MAG: septum formation initiator family protein [Oscillospiraceae bacterium]|jgi:cell division protein FtsB|nr:septum formation initiator family protein [Oscillospiraceae bacterium]
MSTQAANVAQDLSRFDNRRRVREAVAQDILEQSAVKTRAQSRAKEKVRVSGWMLLGFATFAASMFVVVHSHVRLAELSAETGALSREIASLKQEASLLQKLGDGKVNLAAIERIATEELGMTKPTRDQVIYIDLSDGDHAVVLKKPGGFWRDLFGG